MNLGCPRQSRGSLLESDGNHHRQWLSRIRQHTSERSQAPQQRHRVLQDYCWKEHDGPFSRKTLSHSTRVGRGLPLRPLQEGSLQQQPNGSYVISSVSALILSPPSHRIAGLRTIVSHHAGLSSSFRSGDWDVCRGGLGHPRGGAYFSTTRSSSPWRRARIIARYSRRWRVTRK